MRYHGGIAAALLIGLLAAQPASADAQRAGASRTDSTCRLGKTPSKVQMNQVLTIKGKIRPKRARKVRAQVRVKRRWRVVARGRSARRTGAFRLKLRLKVEGPVKVRALAPRTRRLAAATCRARKITVQAPDGSNPSPAPEPGPDVPAPPPEETGPAPGNSFRAVYAVASDQAAAAGKIPAIVSNIKAVNGWYATQTTNNVQPRWMRARNSDGTVGDPTVVTVTLPRPAAAYNGGAGFDTLADDLAATAPPDAPSQKTVVWLDAGNAACGETGRGLSVLWEAACDIHPSTADTFPFGATYLLAHEMTHNFGAVPSCAPHQDGSSHVNDDPRDVLYQGPQPRVWNDQRLDPGHDDYYETGRADCAGIAGSAYWTMTADIGS